MVSHFWYTCTGSSISVFHNAQRLRDLGFEKLVLEGVHNYMEPEALSRLVDAMREEPSPHQLGVAHDQWQVQLTGIGWMQELGLTIEGLADPQHRAHNDAETAICWAGLKTSHHAAILICNALLGPWGTCAFFHGVVAEGKNSVVAMQPDDPWLLRYWPGIVKDNGWQEVPGIYNKEARQKWLEEELPDHPCYKVLGTKVEPNKWMSFHDGFSDFLDVNLHTRGMLLGKMCARSGKITCVEDLFVPAMDSDGFEPFEGDEEDVHAAGPSRARANREAKATIDDLRKRMNTTVAAAARVSCDEDMVNGMRMVALGTRSENHAFRHMMKHLKGAADSLDYYWEQAQWGYLKWCKETLQCLTDTLALSRCGFVVHFPTTLLAATTLHSASVRYQDHLATKLMRLCTNLISNRVGSHLVHTHSYPGKLALSLRAETTTAALTELDNDLAAWHAAKDLWARCKHSSQTHLDKYTRGYLEYCEYSHISHINACVNAGQDAPHDQGVVETEPFPSTFQQVVHRFLPRCKLALHCCSSDDDHDQGPFRWLGVKRHQRESKQRTARRPAQGQAKSGNSILYSIQHLVYANKLLFSSTIYTYYV